MRDVLTADFVRMYRGKRLWLCALFMAGTALGLLAVQYAGMDYTVALDRVIFLPMSFYGIAVAALISLFTGEDFESGVLRNKLIAGHGRACVYLSNLLVCACAALTLYLATTAVTVIVGTPLFEINVTAGKVLAFTALGCATCLAYAGVFVLLATLIGNRTRGVIVCMALAFGMLFLCLHTNQVLMQKPLKDGAANIHYVDGARRLLYEYLHDGNPSGQAAQLSSMTCLNPARWLLIDAFWVLLSGALGCLCFGKKDIA